MALDDSGHYLGLRTGLGITIKIWWSHSFSKEGKKNFYYKNFNEYELG
jgi:hypothetical protein